MKRALFAVFRQTVRASLRSRVFHILLVLNMLAVFVLPLTVTSDGTASGELKLSLTYSLTTVAVLLSLSTVWLGCIGLSREIESYNLHMVLTKPAPGWLVWTGKWLGVFGVNALILVVSSGLIYGLIMARFHYGDWPNEELEEARNEILVGRRIYEPVRPDFGQLARQRYDQLAAQGRIPEENETKEVMKELRRQIRARATEVQYGNARVWRFQNVRARGDDTRVFIRYRLYVASTSQTRQRMTNGIWVVANPSRPPEQQAAALPQRVAGGSFHEFSFPAGMLEGTDTIYLQYVNQDPGRESIIFQPEDGPSLMIRVTGFTSNWLRATLVYVMRLAVLAALGCLFGAAFSAPVAVFVALACLVLGAAADPSIGEPLTDSAGQIISWPWQDMLAHAVAVTLDLVLVTLDAGQTSFKLARGRLIELTEIGRVVVFELLIKGGIVSLLGMFILSRRELGKVIRK